METSATINSIAHDYSAQRVREVKDKDVELPTLSNKVSDKDTLCYLRQSRIPESERCQEFLRGRRGQKKNDLPETSENINHSMHERPVEVELVGNVPQENASVEDKDLGHKPVTEAYGKTTVVGGTASEQLTGGSLVNAHGSKDTCANPEDGDILQKKRKSKFEDRHPPSGLTPVGDQKLYPLDVSKDVWVLHPTRVGSPVALGKTRYSFKTTKSKMQASPWRSVNWETGLQLVEIQKVLQSGVKVMHPSK
ncbi:hypothetical protein M758_N028000 [Ceratodon purpureus]|nr:hypothetical protein M758_N028000 [Ceratodon purpureus]